MIGRYRGWIKYSDNNILQVDSRWDYVLSGLCRYKGELCRFRSLDETNYCEMIDNCPACNEENGTENDYDCTCTTGQNIICEIYSISMLQKLKYYLGW